MYSAGLDIVGTSSDVIVNEVEPVKRSNEPHYFWRQFLGQDC